MDSNEYYRLRKRFSESKSVEKADLGRVSEIPSVFSPLWVFDNDGQTVSSFKTGSDAHLVIFDNVEGKYAYWCSREPHFQLSQDLRASSAEAIEDWMGDIFDGEE